MDNWLLEQIETMLELGFSLEDARVAAMNALATIPFGADPYTWFETPGETSITDEDVEDARIAWYASNAIPEAFKRLLDAGEVQDG